MELVEHPGHSARWPSEEGQRACLHKPCGSRASARHRHCRHVDPLWLRLVRGACHSFRWLSKQNVGRFPYLSLRVGVCATGRLRSVAYARLRSWQVCHPCVA